jgi:hypothetical protein
LIEIGFNHFRAKAQITWRYRLFSRPCFAPISQNIFGRPLSGEQLENFRHELHSRGGLSSYRIHGWCRVRNDFLHRLYGFVTYHGHLSGALQSISGGSRIKEKDDAKVGFPWTEKRMNRNRWVQSRWPLAKSWTTIIRYQCNCKGWTVPFAETAKSSGAQPSAADERNQVIWEAIGSIDRR